MLSLAARVVRSGNRWGRQVLAMMAAWMMEEKRIYQISFLIHLASFILGNRNGMSLLKKTLVRWKETFVKESNTVNTDNHLLNQN